MEGANGKILDTEDPNVVIKKIHRRHRAYQRSGSLSAEQQMIKQENARKILEHRGCKILFVPRAWDAERFQYKMNRIQIDNPLELLDARSHPVFAEIKLFYEDCKSKGIFPADFELYVQPDGRVAMVDFDKFGEWKGEEIVFPWGLTVHQKQLLEPLGLC